MHCASCATLIQGEMQELPGVASCEINLINHTATVSFTADELPLQQLNKKLQPFGYELVATSLLKGGANESVA
ncbi:MAG: heavy-metal-associated domain-containing protein [Candidatus Peribacteria bacterium]|jgi:copper chaperone CopZ|nr:heavy-metal-associated domain-containing protein [Candidatus Peribacteria bacterium]